jgi:hypothetical protein
MSIKNVTITGAIVGTGIAVVMIALENANVGRISIPLSGFVDKAIFTVCPFYVLGFTNIVANKTSWFLVTTLGNAVLYGIVFGVTAGIVSLFRKTGYRKV